MLPMCLSTHRPQLGTVRSVLVSHDSVTGDPVDRALTVGDVAELLGVSRTTVREWVSRGEFPPPRAFGPKLLRWLSSDVDDWMQTRLPAHEVPERRALTDAALVARRQSRASR